MFEEIGDRLSLLGSFRWPLVIGEITAIDVEKIKIGRNLEQLRLSAAYEFYVGNDGPYTGESHWFPRHSLLTAASEINQARQKIRVKQPIEIRYRPSDPSINTATRGLRELLR